jgi:hypothetical protein
MLVEEVQIAMSTKYTVMALDRKGIGHPNYHCAKRAWPSGQKVEIEVLDQDDDPFLTKERPGETPLSYPDPVRLGRRSFDEVRSDNTLMVHAVGAGPEEAVALQMKIADLQSAAAGANTRAELAERECARLTACAATIANNEKELFDEQMDLQDQVIGLQKRIAELEAQLDEATAPNPVVRESAKTSHGQMSKRLK